MKSSYWTSIIGILKGIGVFIILSLIWWFTAAPFIAWVLDLDPEDSWLKGFGNLMVCFGPLAFFIWPARLTTSRTSGNYSGIVTLVICLVLIVAGFIALAILYFYMYVG